MHILSTTIQGALISSDRGQYLQGPRTPETVKRLGYGFTLDPDKAWPFHTAAEAGLKARHVARHMSWDADRIKIETLNDRAVAVGRERPSAEAETQTPT